MQVYIRPASSHNSGRLGRTMTLLREEDALGEDTSELLATIEESFGIRFPDYREVVGKSVQELAAYISDASQHLRAEDCLSAIMFYRLRRAFCDLFGTPRAVIRPGTPIAVLLPWRSRRARWHRLQRHLDLTLPKLTYPLWLVGVSLVAAVSSCIGLETILGLGFVGIAIGSFVLWICALLGLFPLARNFPRSCETCGDLVRLVLARNYSSFASQYGGSSVNEIVGLLRQLMAAELGIGLSEITPDTRIHGYLGIE
jgi:hypothetical protein